MPHRVLNRREVRVACIFEVPGAIPLNGQTRDLSGDAATIQSAQMQIAGMRKPRLGDTGVLTLAFRSPGASREQLKIPCRVAHVSGIIVGLQLNVMILTPPQKESYVRLLNLKT
jgi:hypothetical protein